MDAAPNSSSVLPLKNTVKTSGRTIYNLFSPGSIDLAVEILDIDMTNRDLAVYSTTPDQNFAARGLIAVPTDPLEAVSDDDSYDSEGRLIADSDPEECGCLQGKYSGKKRDAKTPSPKKVTYAKNGHSVTYRSIHYLQF
jgi:hypothetical protein